MDLISEVSVGVFTGLLAVVAAMQFLLYRRMYHSAHRPKLRVRNVVVPYAVEIFQQVEASGRPGEFEIANVGGTTATLVFSNVRLTCLQDLSNDSPHNEAPNAVQCKIKIASGETRCVNIPVPAFSEQEIASVITHGRDRGLGSATDLDFYVVGILKYTDRAGLERKTAICRKFDRKKMRFFKTRDPDYEYED